MYKLYNDDICMHISSMASVSDTHRSVTILQSQDKTFVRNSISRDSLREDSLLVNVNSLLTL